MYVEGKGKPQNNDKHNDNYDYYSARSRSSKRGKNSVAPKSVMKSQANQSIHKSCAHHSAFKSQVNTTVINFSIANQSNLPPERYLKAAELLSQKKTLEETFEVASKGGDALTYLKSRIDRCNCHEKQLNMIKEHLKLTKPIKEEPDGVNLGDGMSNFGEREETKRKKKLTFNERMTRLSYYVGPCRRSCSTTHHPIFHEKRMEVMKVEEPPRPSTADRIRALKKAELDKIDFYKTALNKAIVGRPLTASAEKKKRKKIKKKDLKIETNLDNLQVSKKENKTQSKQENKYDRKNTYRFENSPYNMDLDLSNKKKPKIEIKIEDGENTIDPSIQQNNAKKSSIEPDQDTVDWRKSQTIKTSNEPESSIVDQKVLREIKKKDDGMLSDVEVDHYYSLVKKKELFQDLSNTERKQLNKRCWKTLNKLMTSMYLKKEYDIIKESNIAKQDAIERMELEDRPSEQELKNRDVEDLIKLLIRCKKMHNAKEEIIKILIRVNKRKNLIEKFNQEILEICTERRAKVYYYILLKMSYQLFNQIERLRVDHPLLNRPFIYKDESLQNTLIRQMIKIRKIIIKIFPETKNDLNSILDKSGQIVNVENLQELNKRMQLYLEQQQVSTFTTSYLRIPSYSPTLQEEVYSPTERDKGRNLRIFRGNQAVQLESEETNSPSPVRLRLQMRSLQSETIMSDEMLNDRQQLTHENMNYLKKK